MLLVCFSLCTLGYAAAAAATVLGYLKFGQDVQSQITLDLPAGKLSPRLAIYTTLVIPIAKYAWMLTPTIKSAKSMVPSHWWAPPCPSVTSLWPLPFVCMDNFGTCRCIVSSSILVPSVCYLKISGAYKRFGSDMIINYSIILMGVAIAFIGTYTSFMDIIVYL